MDSHSPAVGLDFDALYREMLPLLELNSLLYRGAPRTYLLSATVDF